MVAELSALVARIASESNSVRSMEHDRPPEIFLGNTLNRANLVSFESGPTIPRKGTLGLQEQKFSMNFRSVFNRQGYRYF